MHDKEIIDGLVMNSNQRPHFEKALYLQYRYFIEEGIRKYKLNYEDSFSAYSDAILSVIKNIINKSFNNNSTLKTYLFQVFSNKCIDLIRKRTTNIQKVHQSAAEPELLSHLPDKSKSVIEKLIDQQKLLQIRQYLEMIGEKCKEILLLFEDGYTDKEIAEKLSYNTASVGQDYQVALPGENERKNEKRIYKS
ncbi:MAG: sigma-70 family RNA polymerase sigma factor [Segetibacter sp.]